MFLAYDACSMYFIFVWKIITFPHVGQSKLIQYGRASGQMFSSSFDMDVLGSADMFSKQKTVCNFMCIWVCMFSHFYAVLSHDALHLLFME